MEYYSAIKKNKCCHADDIILHTEKTNDATRKLLD